MRIAITDANIFIDLHHAALTDCLFALGLEIHTTIDVFDELNAAQQEALNIFVEAGTLTLNIANDEPLPEAIKAVKGLSPSDISVLRVAIQLDAVLLTGDLKLRKISNIQHIEVHGIFWLFDKFREHDLASKETCMEKLKALMDYNKRLPAEECEKRFKTWI